MRRLIFCTALVLVCSAGFSQDVVMESNSSEYELLHIENTGSSEKQGVTVINNVGGYSTGMYIQSTGAALMAEIVNSSNDYVATGISSYVGDDDVWMPTAIYGDAYGREYSNVNGIRGFAAGGENANVVGVYGSAWNAGGGFVAAGYFDGDVHATDFVYISSDEKLKTNIKDYENGLGRVLALRPRSYQMKTAEYKGRLNLPKGNKVGFVAQELEVVFPDLVKETVAPIQLTAEERKNKVKKEPLRYKSVDYTSLVPVLVKAMQEQQAQIEALRVEVQTLKASR